MAHDVPTCGSDDAAAKEALDQLPLVEDHELLVGMEGPPLVKHLGPKMCDYGLENLELQRVDLLRSISIIIDPSVNRSFLVVASTIFCYEGM